jgi:membrane associated rhomboid family serine protease
MRGEPGQMSMQFPKPGPVLRAFLIALVALGVGWALLVNWTSWGAEGFLKLTCMPDRVFKHFEVWRLFTAGLLTSPQGSISHLFFTLIGLYFLSPDLERRWGSARFAWFLTASLSMGFLAGCAVAGLGLSNPIFHPTVMYGATAAITAVAVAWARENSELEVRLFFVVPVKGKYLFWFTLLYCVLGVVYADQMSEGVIAPFGGVLVGISLGGSPSTLRRAYLQLKLALLRRRSGSASRTGARPPARQPPRAGAPPLRVLQGGLEEELRKREPPKDKRYLN